MTEDDKKYQEVLDRLDRKHGDYYSIEWPIVSRDWTFGTYVEEVLDHYYLCPSETVSKK